LQTLLKRAIKRATQSIEQTISDQLALFPEPLARKAIIQRVLSNPIVDFNAQKHFKFSKQGIIEQELLSSLVQSLIEVKASNNATKLAIKHTILIAIMNSTSNTSLRQKTCLLIMHPRNVS
jgi:hypothetical protein